MGEEAELDMVNRDPNNLNQSLLVSFWHTSH